MKVSIIIPVRLGDVWREELWAWVLARFFRRHPEFEICTSDSSPGPFNRGEARNLAVAKSTGDVLIFCDADTFCNEEFLVQLLDDTVEYGYAFPYGKYYNLTKDSTLQLLKQPCIVDLVRPTPGTYEHELDSTGGLFGLTREAWDKTGGYPTQFRGWGFEDNTFEVIIRRLHGKPKRNANGFVCHLWHETPEVTRFEQPDIEYNRRIYERFRRAKNAAEVRSLCQEYR